MFVEVKSSIVDIIHVRQKKTLEFLSSRGCKVLICMIPLSNESVKEIQNKGYGTLQVMPKIMEFNSSNKSLISFIKSKD